MAEGSTPVFYPFWLQLYFGNRFNVTLNMHKSVKSIQGQNDLIYYILFIIQHVP